MTIPPITIQCDYWRFSARARARGDGRCPNTLTSRFVELHEMADALGWDLLTSCKQYCPYHARPLA